MKKFLMRGVAFAAIAVPAMALLPTAAYAQETTSSIRGTVTSNGAPVAGATVTITHVPSGTMSTVTTGADGSFAASALRVGGPFTVKVTAAGFDDATITDVETVVAQAYNLPVDLLSQGAAIVVTARSIKGAGVTSQGPVTVLTSEDINRIASVNRDVRDLSRRDPFARLDDSPTGGRAVSFAGQNARYNKFSVDGVAITDNFGLNTDGLPSRRSPIPLDAIGQFSAEVAPYDVRQGNFQGGAINIILRSGTNNWQGTAFGAYSSDELTGTKTKAGPGIATGVVTLPNFSYKNYGAELSGPIIADRLFFMIAGERVRAPTPIAQGPIDNNAGTAIPGLTQAMVDTVTRIAGSSPYNYDTGGVLKTNGDKDDRLVAKIDANLSEDQHASLTFNYAKDAIYLVQNAFTTPPPGLGLASNAYIQGNELYSGVFQLNSKWSDEFSTEVRGFYKDYTRIQDPLMGRGFAQIRVCATQASDRPATGADTASTLSTGCAAGVPVISFGPDVSRQTNALNSRTMGGLVQARLTRDDHDLRIFADIQHTRVVNSFVQRSSGEYYFDSFNDLAAGTAQRFQYQTAVPSFNADDAAAVFKYYSYSFGIQDRWRVNDMLTIAYGARYDMFGGNSHPAVNSFFLSRYGFANNAYIGGLGVFQPRIGFNFKPLDRLSIRGGIGIFSGGAPDVYVSNSFSNTGVLTRALNVFQNNNNTYSGNGFTITQAQGISLLTGVNGIVPSVANTVLVTAPDLAATTSTNALDPNFKIPSQWRGTLSFNYDANLGPLGDHWRFSADVLYSSVRNQVFFTDLRSVPIAGSLTPDGRQRYRPCATTSCVTVGSLSDTGTDILLTNSKKGRTYIAVAQLEKKWAFGLGIHGSFTYQDVKDQNPATSSTAGSNYGNGGFVDPNFVAYGISNDEVKYAFKYDMIYEHAFFGDYKSTFALFGETRIGHPYSFTFQDFGGTRSSVFGTTGSSSATSTAGDRYLLYVPTLNDPLVSYSDAAMQTAFNNFVDASGLGKYRGKVAPRNAFNSKWFTRLDLHVAQELPTGVGNSRFTIFGDVENVTNLINKNWGQIREYVFPYLMPVARVQCLTTAGNANGAGTVAANSTEKCAQYRYSPVGGGATFVAPTDTIYARQSLYSIRVGARISF